MVKIRTFSWNLTDVSCHFFVGLIPTVHFKNQHLYELFSFYSLHSSLEIIKGWTFLLQFVQFTRQYKTFNSTLYHQNRMLIGLWVTVLHNTSLDLVKTRSSYKLNPRAQWTWWLSKDAENRHMDYEQHNEPLGHNSS